MIPDPPHWHAHAACAGRDDLNWFPPPNADLTQHKAVCDACAVHAQCLAHALEHERYGVWAGTSEADRRRMRRGRSVA